MQNPRPARTLARLVAALTAVTFAVTGVAATATTAAAASVATGTTVAAVQVAAASKTTPTIKGTVKVANRLTAMAGTWPKGTRLTYAWKVGGSTVGTARTFTPKASHHGKKVQLVVTGRRAGHAKVVRYSAKKTVAAGTLSAATPKMTGSAKVGSTLKVTRGTWSPAPSTLTYRWYAGSSAISGATGTSFKPTSAHVGKKITVRVTGKRAGFTTRTRVSAATSAVTLGAPRITTPPQGDYVQAGRNVRFTVGATGGGLTYQWQRMGQADDTWSNLSGRTSSTLSFTARSADTLAQYRVVVKNAAGTATSDAAMLFVDSAEDDPYAAETVYVGNYWMQVVAPTEADDLGGGSTEVWSVVSACSLGGDADTPYWDLYSEYRAGGVWYDGDEYDLGADEDDPDCGYAVISAVVPTVDARGGIWAITDVSGSADFGPTTQYIDGLD